MSVEIHKEMVRNEFKLWELEGDEKLIDECYASDCIWHAPGAVRWVKSHAVIRL
jgi:hypothetical protein